MKEHVVQFLSDDETNISITENELLRAMMKLQLGEILHVEIPEEPKTVIVSTISPRQLSFIEIIRQGYQHFDKIVVESGDPVSVVVSYVDGGFQCRKTILCDQEH